MDVNVGDLIKLKREALGLSARDLSIRIGKSSSYVSKLESGTLDPTLNTFARLASELSMNHYEVSACLAVEINKESDEV